MLFAELSGKRVQPLLAAGGENARYSLARKSPRKFEPNSG